LLLHHEINNTLFKIFFVVPLNFLNSITYEIEIAIKFCKYSVVKRSLSNLCSYWIMFNANFLNKIQLKIKKIILLDRTQFNTFLALNRISFTIHRKKWMNNGAMLHCSSIFQLQEAAESCFLWLVVAPQLMMGPSIKKLWWECYQKGKIVVAGEPHSQPQYQTATKSTVSSLDHNEKAQVMMGSTWHSKGFRHKLKTSLKISLFI
jgi:hypothetical protein